ncbi:MAG: hypothetical protein HFH56_02300 [Lachnospiraceae bacterium]|nr:hypothetical protein [Lachnospiraceae bacterium]
MFVADTVGVGVFVADTVGVGVFVADTVGIGVSVADTVGVDVAVGVGLASPCETFPLTESSDTPALGKSSSSSSAILPFADDILLPLACFFAFFFSELLSFTESALSLFFSFASVWLVSLLSPEEANANDAEGPDNIMEPARTSASNFAARLFNMSDSLLSICIDYSKTVYIVLY